MSTRPVKMTVNNNTGKVLRLIAKHAEHGEFTTNPPGTIEASGWWACDTVPLGLIGPEGTVTYQTEDKVTTVEFYYCHPMGPSTSSYRVTTNPSDTMGYDIKGSFTGHDQSITFELYAL
jgi:hypothetical protein